MNAIRVMTLTDGTTEPKIRLPDDARIAEVDGKETLRVPPGEGFEDFAEGDGLIEIVDFLIVAFAEVGDCGLAPLDKAPWAGGMAADP
jgi:hypothetical protein